MGIRSSILLLPFSVLLIALLVGCGTEVGRIPFSDIGSGKTELMIDASKQIDFWTDLDLVTEEDVSLAHSIMAESDVSLAYSIVLYQSGAEVHRVACDPFDISSFDIGTKFRNVNTSIRTTRSFRYKGKMRCSVRVPNEGVTVVDAVLKSIDPADGSLVQMPDSFKLTNADLVIKQR